MWLKVNPLATKRSTGTHPTGPTTSTTKGNQVNIHEQEERDFGRGPQLWDADPDVCCAAFQLGACEHTEGPEAELTWAELGAEHDARFAAELAARSSRKCSQCWNTTDVTAGQCRNPQGGAWGSQAPCYCACHTLTKY